MSMCLLMKGSFIMRSNSLEYWSNLCWALLSSPVTKLLSYKRLRSGKWLLLGRIQTRSGLYPIGHVLVVLDERCEAKLFRCRTYSISWKYPWTSFLIMAKARAWETTLGFLNMTSGCLPRNNCIQLFHVFGWIFNISAAVHWIWSHMSNFNLFLFPKTGDGSMDLFLSLCSFYLLWSHEW